VVTLSEMIYQAADYNPQGVVLLDGEQTA